MKVKAQPINEQIRSNQVQVINHAGDNLGIIDKSEALMIARGEGLDLVQISPEGKEGIPVAKIMDFGKEIYAKKKKLAESKKKQKVVKIKEIKLRPKIGAHDYQTKLNQGIQFLQKGMRLKVTLMFRGRENANKAALGPALFERVSATFKENGLDNILQEQDSKAGQFWSRVYFLKN
ncbi:MAG TPA: translation initiation factor IF-3 [Candidatus Babeliales bacterium]|nr:translation initiation factor IF-3 [Candidatus Babeliales bacterium]